MKAKSLTQNEVMPDSAPRLTLGRLLRFMRKPWRQQYRSLASRVQNAFPSVPIPVRLPFDAWYLAGVSDVDSRIVFGGFELAETAFMRSYLRAGMTVLDIGAHHGFYSLLASKAVGAAGAVHAFEPAPRERAFLRRNLLMNGCRNVTVHELALGAEPGQATLFQAQAGFDGLNSLREQGGVPRSTPFPVRVATLDEFWGSQQSRAIDFIKMDIEGGELNALEGARRLLESPSRPVICSEVSDLRTKAWGYRASGILKFLEDCGYRWFEPDQAGELRPADTRLDCFDHNLVAVPPEKGDAIRHSFPTV